jgi:hypothetical protein
MQTPIRKGLLAAAAVTALVATTFLPTAGASMSANGAHHHRRHHRDHLVLTDAQKQCLVAQGVTRPIASAKRDGAAPTPTALETFRAALTACGIVLPAHATTPTTTAPPPPVAALVAPAAATPQPTPGTAGPGGGHFDGPNDQRHRGFDGHDDQGRDHGFGAGGGVGHRGFGANGGRHQGH